RGSPSSDQVASRPGASAPSGWHSPCTFPAIQPLRIAAVRVLVIAESTERADIVRRGLLLAGHETADIADPGGLAVAMQQARADAIVLESYSPDVDLLDRIVD